MLERRGYQLMIIPLTFWSGVEQGFFGADFTAVSICSFPGRKGYDLPVT